MNCKPGDLAILVRSKWNLGRLVEVLYAAPVGVKFSFPDGLTASCSKPNKWVVKSLGAGLFRNVGGKQEWATYGHAYDAHLRPIRPEPERESTPQHEPAEAT